MRRKNNRSRPIAEINVVPYIDVMLVLLVIFMITAPILTQGVAVELPTAVSEKITSEQREPVIVSIDDAGRYYLNIADIPSKPIDLQALMVRVAAEIQLAKDSTENLQVLVKGDKNVAYGKIVSAMSSLKQAGAEKVGLLTDSEQPTKENS